MENVPDYFWIILFFAYGAIVGSFLNVVVYRLPEGKSLVSPPSTCPKCNHRLAWYDNVPILGWLWLRGKCRYCKTNISVQYPIVELINALLFAGLYVVYYMTDMRPEFSRLGFIETWPIFITHLILISGLFAATVIDSRLYIIPLHIPYFIIVFALIAMPVGVALGYPQLSVVPPYFFEQPLPVATKAGVGAAMGGLIALGLALMLVKTKTIPRAFEDWEEQIDLFEKQQAAANKKRKHEDRLEAEEVQEEIFFYPHPRREVLKELMFVAFPTLGLLLGMYFVAGHDPAAETSASLANAGWFHVLCGCIGGYLVGCGVVWFTRILGTLAFGKEAMGLGDVHLLGAIGAVLGASDSVLVFFIAPFIGLVAAIGLIGVSAIYKGKVRVIPYGPYLAGAAVVVMILRQPILAFLGLNAIQ